MSDREINCSVLQPTRIRIMGQTPSFVQSPFFLLLLFSQQHTVTHCNTLQHTATHCNMNRAQILQMLVAPVQWLSSFRGGGRVLHGVAVCWRVLQRGAVLGGQARHSEGVAVCCRVLQGVAWCCSVCWSVLQRNAVL